MELFYLNYEITITDYLEADMAWCSKPWLRRLILQGMPVFLIVGSLFSVFSFPMLYENATASVLLTVRVACFVASFIGILLPIYMRPPTVKQRRTRIRAKEINQNPFLIGERSAILDAEGISVSYERKITIVHAAWRRVTSVQETENLFVFYFKGQAQLMLLPKRAFQSAQQLIDFRAALDSWLKVTG